MKPYLLTLLCTAAFCFSSCSQSEPEPDFSALQDLPYTVEQLSTTTRGETHISFYPNPFVETLNIQLHNLKESPAIVYISDEKGKYTRKLETMHEGGIVLRLNFHLMPKGVYTCEVQHAGRASRYRLIKAY